MVPAIGVFQGLLLYGICIVTFLICKGSKFSLSCSFNDLSDEELDALITKAKMDAERRMKMTSIELCKAKLEELETSKKEETELKIQSLGFSLLIILAIYVTYNDVLRIF